MSIQTTILTKGVITSRELTELLFADEDFQNFGITNSTTIFRLGKFSVHAHNYK